VKKTAEKKSTYLTREMLRMDQHTDWEPDCAAAVADDNICENLADGATDGAEMRLACIEFSLYGSHQPDRVFPIKPVQ
jgi:hypothetical protein